MLLKKIKIFLSALSLVLCFTCSKSTSSGDETKESDKDILKNKVLIIGIDGCRPDALTQASTPNIDALIANSTYSLDARCLFTTSSGPGWTSMLSGVWQDKHAVTDNSYSNPNFAAYPHFFKRVEEANSDNRTVSIVQWNPINNHMASLDADVIINSDTDEDAKNAVKTELATNDPTILFLQLSNVDFAGHGTGFSPSNPNYMSAIETVDTQVGSIISILKNRDNYDNENWLILLSTDHGGLGTSHGGPSEEERTIFVIASGDKIPNKEIVAPTEEVIIPPANNCLNSNHELWFDDAYVEIPHNNNFNFGANQDFSLECRIRSTIPGDVSLLGKKNWSSGANPGFVFSFKPSTKKFKVNVGDTEGDRIDLETEEITDNEWHTISATFDRDGDLKVYIDGVLKGSTSMESIGDIDNNLPFTIGADGNLNWRYKGYVAEVRLFNTLLDASDIDDWKCKVLDNTHPKYANVLGHWKLTEGSGIDIIDSSSNGYNGTLANAEWKDATVSTVETIKIFDNTPRTVDVAVTALNHLCIPIKTEWDLEGNSLIDTNCSN